MMPRIAAPASSRAIHAITAPTSIIFLLLIRGKLSDRNARGIFVVLRGMWIIQNITAGDLGRRPEQARDGIGQGRFAAATFTGQAENLTPLQREADIGNGVYRSVRGQVINVEMLHFEKQIG